MKSELIDIVSRTFWRFATVSWRSFDKMTGTREENAASQVESKSDFSMRKRLEKVHDSTVRDAFFLGLADDWRRHTGNGIKGMAETGLMDTRTLPKSMLHIAASFTDRCARVLGTQD